MTSAFFSENYRKLDTFEASRLKKYLQNNDTTEVITLRDLFKDIEDWELAKHTEVEEEIPPSTADGLVSKKLTRKKPSLGDLLLPKEGKTLDELILHTKTKRVLKEAIHYCKNFEVIHHDWGLDQLSNSKCILNFYGQPGTGKTLASKVMGKELNLPILHIDYSKLISKYVGETGKNIAKAFREAEKLGAILLLDEADAVISKRLSVTGSNSFYINQEINTFMQEIDRFNGILILTSNFFENFDPAMLRRISYHIEFKLPDLEMRKNLIKMHVPKKIVEDKRFAPNIDLEKVATVTDGFSGGDILNLVINSIKSAATRAVEKPNDVITENDLTFHADQIRIAKKSQGMISNQRRITLI